MRACTVSSFAYALGEYLGLRPVCSLKVVVLDLYIHTHIIQHTSIAAWYSHVPIDLKQKLPLVSIYTCVHIYDHLHYFVHSILCPSCCLMSLALSIPDESLSCQSGYMYLYTLCIEV